MKPDFEKMSDGLVPAIVQDAATHAVLMLGYMNAEAFERTTETGKVWFYSRSKQRLWLKGERSGNELRVVDARLDCDRDAILVCAHPAGPVCHTGEATCFGPATPSGFLSTLEAVIASRKTADANTSYTASLFRKGMNAIAQKVGEEAVELIIEAKDTDNDRFRNEAADLLFHYMILLQAKGFRLSDIEQVLAQRHKG